MSASIMKACPARVSKSWAAAGSAHEKTMAMAKAAIRKKRLLMGAHDTGNRHAARLAAPGGRNQRKLFVPYDKCVCDADIPGAPRQMVERVFLSRHHHNEGVAIAHDLGAANRAQHIGALACVPLGAE